MPLIRNSLVLLFFQVRSFDELKTVRGRWLLKKPLLVHINGILGRKLVKVYYGVLFITLLMPVIFMGSASRCCYRRDEG